MKPNTKYTYLSFGIASILTFSLLAIFPHFQLSSLLEGLATGSVFFLAYYFIDRWLLKSLSIKNIANIFLGLLLGTFLAHALITFIEKLAPGNQNILDPYAEAGIYLFATFTSMITIIRTSGKTYIQLPFVKLSSLGSQEHSLILDKSALEDPRLIGLLESGFIRHHLIIPTFVQKHILAGSDEGSKKAKACLERIQESHASWHLTYSEPELSFSQDRCYNEKIKKAVRLLQADLLVKDGETEIFHLSPGRKVLSLQMLSTILKPVINSSENLKITVQRQGKEPAQGVGYLEDGTMVVINGGGDFIGEEVDTRIISTKHSSTGRIIFCNLNRPTLPSGSKKRQESKELAGV